MLGIIRRGKNQEKSNELLINTRHSIDCIRAVCAYHGIPTNEQSLISDNALDDHINQNDILRIIKRVGLKSKLTFLNIKDVDQRILPLIAILKDGTPVVIARILDGRLLIRDSQLSAARILTAEDFRTSWVGTAILVTKRLTLDSLGQRFDISWFLAAMIKYRGIFSEVLAASLFLQLFALVSPLFFQGVVDKVLVHRGLDTLDVLVFGLVVVSLFDAVLGGLRTYVFSHTTNRIDVELGARLFRHLLALPLGYFTNRRVGDSVARVRELENIRNFLTGSALTLVVDLVFTLVFIAVMLMYSGWLTGIVLLSLPFYAAISIGAGPLFRRRLDEKFRRGAENQAFLVETVAGIETLKAMAVEPQLQRKWEEQLAGYVQASFRVGCLGNAASQTIQLISKLVTAGVLYFGAGAVITGKMTIGELVAFNMLATRISQPVLRLAQLGQDFHQARLSVDRLGDILNSPTEPRTRPGQSRLPALKGSITLEHVRFRYRPDAPPVLEGLSVTVAAGQSIGIVGPSGSGKSTLTKLLQRLYLPESGRILMDGVDIAQVDTAWLRRQIGAVLQENVLMSGTVRENIALADPALPLERVIHAAQLAGAHEFILALPQGYDTVVGERGASLSGGQRQRVAIARALVTDPRILIFDEATSALDYESEHIIQQNLGAISRNRTVFIVAHRLSAVRHCHRILTLEGGRLVEDGTHEDLIRAGGRYAMLHHLQAGNTPLTVDIAVGGLNAG
ncbi:type I secretion system permease/ATPase [Nitrospirillum sp. BR 11163]|uniref:type I secretion system permease/ATPase n=1 Tax=Nitrospirillum sp. BR 11163 TaxID=3104323 RepID=UPI002AFE2FBC|nr:type I secretion system permease/ATPase [Nitrospirillum sp. BR 11163]MEA1675435.1 type I secretion system permease/ATPase [Nitrospirillum sp. BR 11163]